MEEILKKSREAFHVLMRLNGAQKNELLGAFSQLIEEKKATLLEANKKDLLENKDKISSALYQRLELTESKIQDLRKGIAQLQESPEPVFETLEKTELDSDLILEKVRVPLGVLAVVFESRPDVLPQIFSLALKSANAVVFKGGKEALNTNRAFMALIAELSERFAFFPKDSALLLEDRADVWELLKYPQWIDLVIPRGSNELVQSIQNNTKIPVLGHADGICHIYVDEFADLEKALKVVVDSKIQYPSACNALETLLVHGAVASTFLKMLFVEAQNHKIQLRGCSASRALVSDMNEAQESDWATEYGDLILSVKVVEDMEDALAHIRRYSSKHTDGILSENHENIELFLRSVDSAGVFVNASTRFADGYRYGLGAEVGISTSKIHARGPVGIEGLGTYKYLLKGKGQSVAEYSGASATKTFTHKKL